MVGSNWNQRRGGRDSEEWKKRERMKGKKKEEWRKCRIEERGGEIKKSKGKEEEKNRNGGERR